MIDAARAPRRGWIISDGKLGHEVQCRGVADALSLKIDIKQVHPGALYRALAPLAPVDPRERFAQPGTPFAPPFPDFAFAAGRTTIPYIRALKRHAGSSTYTVILLDPKIRGRIADLVWVPEHDTLRGANVITSPVSPHGYSPPRLAALRSSTPSAIAALPHPRVAVLIGGPNGHYRYGPDETAKFATRIRQLQSMGASLMITPSRRTPPDLLAAALTAGGGGQSVIADDTGPNPYPYFLANADAFFVTADSVNMIGEAASSGKPIYVFTPPGASAKFERFHAMLATRGLTRELTDETRRIGSWSYEPLDSARFIADEIERRSADRDRRS